MATQLGLYNEACRLLGERKLSGLDDNRPVRHMLDAAWASNAHDTWLEEAEWLFAIRSVKIGNDASFSPEWGPAYGFSKPDDMVHVTGIYSDEYFQTPLVNYVTEVTHWVTDAQTIIYVQYVSNGASYGANMGAWPASFAKYVAAFLAFEIAPELKNDTNQKSIAAILMEREKEAKGKNGLKRPSRPAPSGNWVKARLQRGYSESGS